MHLTVCQGGVMVRSVCAYCGVGCGMVLQIGTRPDGRDGVTKTVGDAEHPANTGRLCTKGATTADMLAAPGRLSTALVRQAREDSPVQAGVHEAIADVARRFTAVIDEHGPDAFAMYVSGQMSMEAQYLANKLVKGYIGTNNIESNSRLCMASAGTGYKQSLGADGPPGSYDDFDHADVFLVIGSNMADCHPILHLRLRDRIKQGAKLIVVDPRRTATADKADLHLQVAPGSDLWLLNGILHLLVADDHVDQEFIDAFTDGWDAMPEFLDGYGPDVVADRCGIAVDGLRTAARWIGEAQNWMSCWTMGLNQSTHGTWNTNALCNLHLATGAICRTGSGPFSLTGQPNAMGGREMGYMGPGLPGQRAVGSAEDRAFVEKAWGVPEGTLRTEVGGGTVDMFSRMADGQIRACWIICTNPVASVANRSTVIDGLRRADLVVTQDTFAATETNAYADVILPAALWTESHGTMVNSERTVTLFQPGEDPPGEALPDWQIIALVAREMGFGDAFDYASAEDVFAEIRGFANPRTGYDLRGISYDRLRDGPVQWPSTSGSTSARNPIRYLNDGVAQTMFDPDDSQPPRLAFATPNRRAQFFARPAMDPAEMPDDDFPFVLNTGRLAHQWHTMTKTGRVAKLNKLNPGAFVEIHPDDAGRLGIADSDSVAVQSRRGQVVLPARVADRVRPGGLFVPFHWNDEFGAELAVNAVTNDAVDADSQQPEFKVCAVSVVRVAASVHEHDPAAPPTASGTASRELDADPLSAVASALGVSPVAGLELQPDEQRWLAGFVAGVRSSAPVVGVPLVPDVAPLRPDTRAYVDGLFAGVYSRTSSDGASEIGSRVTASGSDPVDAPPSVTLLYASQTGTAEEFVESATTQLGKSGIDVTARAMDDHPVGDLSGDGTVLFITSTTGDGDPPDNGVTFWDELSGESAPDLTGMRFSVLAFGDSAYDDFCGHGRKLDERLAELGADRIHERIDCEPDFEEDAAGWLATVDSALTTPADPAGTDQSAPSSSVTTPGDTANRASYSKQSPLRTNLVRNTCLNGSGSAKDVRQFGFHLPNGTLTYEAGDALGVWPRNDEALVSEWLDVTGLNGDTAVDLSSGESCTLSDALRDHVEIARITPDLLTFAVERTGDVDLEAMTMPENAERLADWTWGRQSVDLLATYPVRADAQEWMSVLRPMRPRLYSISSSPRVDPREVQLTVSAVRYNLHGTPRRGVCSTFLADHTTDEQVGIFVQKSRHFRPPADSDTPMIMVGPGTGIAPFRAFLHERRALGHTGDNWLFFGERNESTDFYYRDELVAMADDGLLTRLDVAFSRDQERKVYVQDRMREHGAELWRWLNDGASFYVCGDATRMAKDVHDALVGIIAEFGKLAPHSAHTYLKALTAEKRYVRDVY